MTLSLKPAALYAAGPHPSSLTTADVNGDGKLDLVVADSGGGVSVLLGTGTGSFGAAALYAAGPTPVGVAAADFNGDGKADLAVADGAGGVSVLLGTAAVDVTGITTVSSAGTAVNAGKVLTFTVALGSPVQTVGSPTLLLSNGAAAAYNAAASTPTSLVFGYTVVSGQDTADLQASSIGFSGLSTPTSYATGTAPTAVATADVNRDGKIDLLVATSAGVSVLLNDGNGGFGAATTFAAGSGPAALAVADVNGDGTPDLVVADAGGGVAVLLGNGTGGFGAPTLYAAGAQSSGIAVGDLNGDGKADLAVTDSQGGVAVLLGNGAGGFGAATTFAAGPNPASVAIADLDQDGKPDLIVADAGGGVSVLPGFGGGAFGTATNFAAGTGPDAVTTADVNGDGKPDVLVANASAGVSVLLDTSTTGTLLSSAPGSDTGIVVDTRAATVTAVTATPGTADLAVGGSVVLTLGFSEAVIVAGGVPTLTLNDGGTATYTGGSGTASLTFLYTVAAGQNTADLTVTGAVLNTATIKDAAGNAANLAGAAANPAGILQVDTVAPTVTLLSAAPATASLAAGAVVTFTLTLSEAVTVAGGVPTLSLNDGGTATYSGGSGSNALTFRYTVSAGDNTADLTATAAALNGATIVDGAGNAANLAGAVANPAGTLVIDTIAPVVTIGLASDTGVSATDRITSSPVLTGTAEAGGTITVRNGSSVLGTATAGPTGAWRFSPAGLTDGPYTLSAAEADAAGNIGTATLAFTLDTLAPTAPTVAAVAVSGSATPAGSVSFSGTAEANSQVTLFDNGVAVGAAAASGSGAWTVTPAAALPNGPDALTARATDAAGNQSALFAALGVQVFNQAVTTGTLTAGAGDTLLLLGGLQGGAVTYTGAGGSVVVGGVQPVSGTVKGLAAGDTFDLAGVNATGVYAQGQVTLTAAGGSPAGVLTIAGGAVTDRFATQPDGHGGTQVVQQTVTPDATAIKFTDVDTGTSGADPDTAYTGPVTYLQHQFIWTSPDSVAISASQPNTFLHGNAGGDALQVFGGDNVLDGGGGSNFLVGGTGQDTFFVDGRGGVATWSTIVNFHQGDQATIFGFHAGQSTRPLTPLDGTAGYQGATIHSELNGPGTGVQASITFAGVSAATAQSHFVYSTGTTGGADYLLIQYK